MHGSSLHRLLILSLVVLLCSVAGAAGQSPDADGTFGVERLTVEVSPVKKQYLKLEPMVLNITVANPTDRPVTGKFLPFLRKNSLSVLVGTEGAEFRKVASADVVGTEESIQMAEMPPGKVVLTRQILAVNPDEYFPQAGTYALQLELPDLDGDRKALSNVVTVEILDPQDADLSAYEFIRNHETLFPYFAEYQKNVTDAQLAALEEFVTAFPESGYTDYARYAVACKNMHAGDKDKAEAIFLDLSNKSDFAFARNAAIFLDIVRRDLGR